MMNPADQEKEQDLKSVVRLATMSDIHCRVKSRGMFEPWFVQAAEQSDMLVFCGDLTHYGLPEEAAVFIRELSAVLGRIPVVTVLGNHDYEAGKQVEIGRMLMDAGIVLLDGGCFEFRGIGFAGVKGFAGGFGSRALQAWGEPSIKNFVQEAIDEALQLEVGLARLQTNQRIVVLHYAPIRGTVEGESSEIFAFLGSTRLEESIDRHPVTAVFHGHAHQGNPEGRTQRGVPVYNVATPVLKRTFPDQPPFRLIEVPVSRPSEHP